MKKTLLILFLFVLIAIPLISIAQSSNYIAPLNTGDTAAPSNLTTKSGVEGIIKSVVEWVYTIFFILAVLFILLAAYNFLVNAKDENKIKEAKSQLKYAVIAIVIALISTGASLLINSAFTTSAIPSAYAADESKIAPFNTGDMESPIDSTNDAYSLLVTVVKWVYTIFFIIAVLFILFSAYGFVTSKGDEEKVKNAKKQLTYAVIAIAIALVSAGVAALVNNALEDRQSISVPADPQTVPLD